MRAHRRRSTRREARANRRRRRRRRPRAWNGQRRQRGGRRSSRGRRRRRRGPVGAGCSRSGMGCQGWWNLRCSLWRARLSSIGQRLGTTVRGLSRGTSQTPSRKGSGPCNDWERQSLAIRRWLMPSPRSLRLSQRGSTQGNSFLKSGATPQPHARRPQWRPPTCGPASVGRGLWQNAVSGHRDAGATSLALCASAVAAVLDSRWANDPKGRERTAL